MQRLKHPIISFGLVFLQFALIIVLLLSLPLSVNLVALVLQAAAVFIGLWAAKVMHLGHFNIVPDPRADTHLVTKGPYKWVRHPMYLSILLFFLPLVLLNIEYMNVALYVNLGIILFIKLSYEEQLLIDKIPEYQAYQQTSKKLIPFVL